MGVTFTESGKQPKYITKTISEKTGRITKKDFHSFITGNTSGNFSKALSPSIDGKLISVSPKGDY